MNKNLGIFVIACILIIIASVILLLRVNEDVWICKNGQWIKHGNPRALIPNESCSEKHVTNFEDCLLAGYSVLESYPKQCKTSDNKIFSEDIGNQFEKLDLIKINNPRPNQTIQSPLAISGEARGYWFFEASFLIKLFDENNNLITTAVAKAQGDWMTENFVPFEADLNFSQPSAEKGFLVLEKDNPSGLSENADELRIPIKFWQEPEMMKIEVYFNNNKLDPEFSCNKVFPVEREIVKTKAAAKAALIELLKGVTLNEEKNGFFSNINLGVEIQNLVIENKIATVDFNDQLEFQVGGSCRVSAIRAQIIETLKQFPTVDTVIISINGRTEDILRP